MILRNSKNYATDVNTLLSEALDTAIGSRNINLFAKDCRMVDTRMLKLMLDKKLTELPPRSILRTISSASEGRITHTYLYDLCNYKETDEEEDRSWMLYPAKRGEIYFVDFGCHNIDSEQGFIRPALIIQNDLGNEKSSTLVVIPLTSKVKRFSKTHVKLSEEDGLRDISYALTEQIRCISKRRLFYNNRPWRITQLSEEKMNDVHNALEFELGLNKLMFDEDYAFNLIQHIKNLDYDIKNKQCRNLVSLFNEKMNELKKYCDKYKKDYKLVLEDYEKLNAECIAI